MADHFTHHTPLVSTPKRANTAPRPLYGSRPTHPSRTPTLGCGKTSEHRSTLVSVVIAVGKRPVPFRTRKLSPPAPMVLRSGERGRVGHRRHPHHLEREEPTPQGQGSSRSAIPDPPPNTSTRRRPAPSASTSQGRRHARGRHPERCRPRNQVRISPAFRSPRPADGPGRGCRSRPRPSPR